MRNLHEILVVPEGGGRGRETPSGAFYDAADFARHDVLGAARARRIYRVPVWIDVGRDDRSRADRALRVHLRTRNARAFHLHGGGHGGWSSRMPQYLRFYAAACS